MEPSGPAASSDRARSAATAVFVALVAGGQVVALGELLGVRWPSPAVTLVLALGVVPAWVGAWAFRAAVQGSGYARGAIVAPLAWLLWAGSYYAVAACTDPSRAHVLAEGLAARLPFVPAVAPLYLGVHPLSALPFVRATSDDALRRVTIGHVLIVLVSVVAWLSVPVSFPRSLAATGGSFGAWSLNSIRGSDPIVNCLPSTHCAMAFHAAWRLRHDGRLLAGWSAATAVLIAISTMLLRQHYAVDVVAGVALGVVVAWGVDRWR